MQVAGGARGERTDSLRQARGERGGIDEELHAEALVELVDRPDPSDVLFVVPALGGRGRGGGQNGEDESERPCGCDGRLRDVSACQVPRAARTAAPSSA